VLRLEQTEQEIRDLEAEDELTNIVAGLFRTLIDAEVTEGVKAVEHLQGEGLQAVFDNQNLTVRADVELQRGKVSVDLVTVQTLPDGTVVEGLSRDAFGGAVTTVQSALMRIIVLFRRNMLPVLFLDESLPAFDENYVANMGRFLAALCDRLDMDILLVTHNPALVEAADRAYRIRKTGGAARFQEIR
jgi:ABC-type iron transport system FetAB ATPase subunit